MDSHDQIDPFSLFSMRQVVGGCLDWVQEALKIVLADYIEHGNPPLNPRFDINTFAKWDLITLINFFVTNYNEVIMHIKMVDTGLGRTLLFMIKTHRNYWAHQRDFSYRDVYRLCDAIELLFENLDDQRLHELQGKASLVRKQACLYMAKEIYHEKQPQIQGQQDNQVNFTQEQYDHNNNVGDFHQGMDNHQMHQDIGHNTSYNTYQPTNQNFGPFDNTMTFESNVQGFGQGNNGGWTNY